MAHSAILIVFTNVSLRVDYSMRNDCYGPLPDV
jgi:hypothetical protein